MEGEGGPSPGLLHTGIHTTAVSLRIQTKVLWRVKEVLLIIISGPRVNWGCPRGFPGGSEVKNLSAMQETWVPSLGQEDSTGEGNGYSLQCSCLENSMDRGAWRSIVHGIAKSRAPRRDQHFQDAWLFLLENFLLP